MALLVALFLSDNALWIFNYIRFTDKTKAVMYISPEQKQLLNIINEKSDSHTLLITSDVNLAMLSTVYSPVYPWISNRYTTPFYAAKKKVFDDFMTTGNLDSSWLRRRTIFIFNTDDSIENAATNSGFIPDSALIQTAHYKLFFVESLLRSRH